MGLAPVKRGKEGRRNNVEEEEEPDRRRRATTQLGNQASGLAVPDGWPTARVPPVKVAAPILISSMTNSDAETAMLCLHERATSR